CATGSSCRTRPCPTTCRRTRSWPRSSLGSPFRASPSRSPVASASAPERILQRLDWQVVRRLDGLLQGDYRSLFRGGGLDFAKLRETQIGGDLRASVQKAT